MCRCKDVRLEIPDLMEFSISGSGPIMSARGIRSLFSTKNRTSPSKLDKRAHSCVCSSVIFASISNSSREDDAQLYHGSKSSCKRRRYRAHVLQDETSENGLKEGIRTV